MAMIGCALSTTCSYSRMALWSRLRYSLNFPSCITAIFASSGTSTPVMRIKALVSRSSCVMPRSKLT